MSLQLNGSQSSRYPHHIELSCSKGEMLLMLLGKKQEMQLDTASLPALKSGDCIWFGYPPTLGLHIPVMIETISSNASNARGKSTTLTFRLVTQQDAPDAQTAKRWQDAMSKAAKCLKEEYAKAYTYVTATSREDQKLQHNAIDQEMVELVNRLTAEGLEGVKRVAAQLQAPADKLTPQSKTGTSLTAKAKRDPNADGYGVHGKALAAYPLIETTLGTGVLAAMEVLPRIATTKQITCSLHHGRRDLIRLDARARNGHTFESSFEMPMVIDPSTETQTFHADAIDSVMAHNHGYMNATAMRKGLGIGKRENPLIYSYGVAPALPLDLPEDEDKAGTRLNNRRDKARQAAFREETISYRKDGKKHKLRAWVWDEDNHDASLHTAREYLMSLPHETRTRAEALLVRHDERTPEQQNALPTHINKKGTRALPSEVAAIRELPAGAFSEAALTARRNRDAKGKQLPGRREASHKLNGGVGWTVMLAGKPPKAYPNHSPLVEEMQQFGCVLPLRSRETVTTQRPRDGKLLVDSLTGERIDDSRPHRTNRRIAEQKLRAEVQDYINNPDAGDESPGNHTARVMERRERKRRTKTSETERGD